MQTRSKSFMESDLGSSTTLITQKSTQNTHSNAPYRIIESEGQEAQYSTPQKSRDYNNSPKPPIPPPSPLLHPPIPPFRPSPPPLSLYHHPSNLESSKEQNSTQTPYKNSRSHKKKAKKVPKSTAQNGKKTGKKSTNKKGKKSAKKSGKYSTKKRKEKESAKKKQRRMEDFREEKKGGRGEKEIRGYRTEAEGVESGEDSNSLIVGKKKYVGVLSNVDDGEVIEISSPTKEEMSLNLFEDVIKPLGEKSSQIFNPPKENTVVGSQKNPIQVPEILAQKYEEKDREVYNQIAGAQINLNQGLNTRGDVMSLQTVFDHPDSCNFNKTVSFRMIHNLETIFKAKIQYLHKKYLQQERRMNRLSEKNQKLQKRIEQLEGEFSDDNS